MGGVIDNLPGWDDSARVREWPGLPAVTGTLRADACVIGLGGSGLAAIEELLDRGASVIGIDAGRVAAGAAGRNGGFLIGGPAVPLAAETPGWDLSDKIELWRRTRVELDHLESVLGSTIIARCPWINIAGMIGGPRSAEEEAWEAAEYARLDADRRALRRIGIRAVEHADPLGRGFAVPEQARMNPAERALRLAELVVQRGARLFEHSRAKVIGPGRVTLADGAIEAAIIIVAVDGRLDLLVPQLAPLVRTHRLQMLATAPLRRRVLPRAVVSARSGYEWLQQDAAGRLLLGGGRDRHATDEQTPDDRPTAPVQDWIETVVGRVAGPGVPITHRWAASVGYTEDQRALCVPVDEGVVAVGGYSGHGNLVGPVAARAAVAHALAGEPIGGWFRSTLP